MEPKFKIGDRVWDIRDGFVVLEDHNDVYGRLLKAIVEKTSKSTKTRYAVTRCYFEDGREDNNSALPMIYTKEEAQRMWPDVVPKDPIRCCIVGSLNFEGRLYIDPIKTNTDDKAKMEQILGNNAKLFRIHFEELVS